ncbi:YhcN/YlaJ family sporulation lipoprotein [Bacillus sp. FJAT-27445]|uniref:YhcN/YlaJ family sporulation lipoprotein n=1 Tax=Bacillus sp. FJAT-27445 TaxID=1679166 RepID=UPI0007435A08|nr:YhcN/YlaJ family sporulation lipoprotein [Bacillus sp. FJAT-27445]
MKKGSKVLLSALLLIGLAGCGANNNDNGKNKVQTNRARINNVGDNQQLRVSDRAARAVERLKEVDRAHVIVSNNNAYVAVRMNDNNGRNGAGTFNNGNRNDGNNGNMLDNGRIDQHGNDGIINGKGDAGNKNRDGRTYNTGNGGMNGNTGIYGAGNGAGSGFRDYGYGTGETGGYGAGDGMAGGLGNNNGNYLNNNNNNNRGTITGYGNDNNRDVISDPNYTSVNTKFEQKIADQVRKADKSIHKVYISFNPDFYDTMNGYANNINDGRNRSGLFNDFTGTMRGVFGR